MDSTIADLWSKAFVHISNLIAIASTDQPKAGIEATLSIVRLRHLIDHVSSSQALADEQRFRRLHYIETLSNRVLSDIQDIERYLNWHDYIKQAKSENVTVYESSPLSREQKDKALKSFDRLRMSIPELAECCRNERPKKPKRGSDPKTRNKPGAEWLDHWNDVLSPNERALWIAWVDAKMPKPSQFKKTKRCLDLGFKDRQAERFIDNIWHRIHKNRFKVAYLEDAELLRKTSTWTVSAMKDQEKQRTKANEANTVTK